MSDRRIRIRQPLPLDVAGNLIKAIGTMYPDAQIVLSEHGPDLVIDLGTRTARHSKKRIAAEMDDGEPVDAGFSFTPDGVKVSTPQEATLALAEWAYIMLTAHEDAFNYVEQTVTLPADGDREAKRLLLTACWSKGQTPHALRMAAEERAEKAEARLRELEPPCP